MVVTTDGGAFPTEFDETTNAICMTLDAFGVPDEVLHKDQEDVVALMLTIGTVDPDIPLEETMELMDLMFIGLIYHRHMRFKEEDSGEFVLPPEAGTDDYSASVNRLAGALGAQYDVSKDDILSVLNEGAQFLGRQTRDGDVDLRGLENGVALVSLGLLVHRLVPKSKKNPMED